MMSKQRAMEPNTGLSIEIDPELDFAIERFIDAPTRLTSMAVIDR